MIGRIVAAVLVLGVLLSGCTGISFSKAGEKDAQSACAEYSQLQGDNIAAADGIAGMIKAESYAQAAAAANNDYEALGSAAKAFSESMVVGSEDLAQSAWANVARICNDLR